MDRPPWPISKEAFSRKVQRKKWLIHTSDSDILGGVQLTDRVLDRRWEAPGGENKTRRPSQHSPLGVGDERYSQPADSAGVDRAAVRGSTASSAFRDAVNRRLLATADVVAATVAFVVAVQLLGSDSLGVWAVVAVAMIVPVCKLAGLYERDQHLLHKTTLDEAPA